ncbi:MAG: FAD:protein FMN transferase [Opitutae bacterium]|nr:FAD:protein FMN transferase [Opitutae bacterium]
MYTKRLISQLLDISYKSQSYSRSCLLKIFSMHHRIVRLILFLPCLFISLQASKPVSPLKFHQKLMGADVTLVIDAEECEELETAVSKTFAEGNRLNNILSDWEAGSELSILSRSSEYGEYQRVSDELFEVLSFSRKLAKQTDGAFDVTIGPLSRLWRIARHQKKLPSQYKIDLSLSRTGYQKLELLESKQSARLTQKNMVLDLGAVAKGYIADSMLAVLKDAGFPRSLIDAGGDLTIGDAPRFRNGWAVKIGGLANSHSKTIELSNCAVATSGDLEQFLEINGKVYSHIINPRTGYGLESRAQVSVVAENGMFADALASTCLVIGFEQSKEFLSGWSFYQLHYLQVDPKTNEILYDTTSAP